MNSISDSVGLGVEPEIWDLKKFPYDFGAAGSGSIV